VIFGGKGQIGASNRAAGQSQPVERLGAGHLVQQMEVDVEKIRLTLCSTHQVRIPNLLGQSACHDELLRDAVRIRSDNPFFEVRAKINPMTLRLRL
jgi:hypothetical protein